MKAQVFRDLSLEELNLKLKDMREELFNLRFQNGTNQLENTSKLSKMKKDIARAMTVIREKERVSA